MLRRGEGVSAPVAAPAWILGEDYWDWRILLCDGGGRGSTVDVAAIRSFWNGGVVCGDRLNGSDITRRGVSMDRLPAV